MVDAKNETIKDKDGKPLLHEVFNFGKYKGWDVAEVLKRDPGYYSWMLSSDFSINTSLGRMRYALINMRRLARENKMALQLV